MLIMRLICQSRRSSATNFVTRFTNFFIPPVSDNARAILAVSLSYQLCCVTDSKCCLVLNTPTVFLVLTGKLRCKFDRLLDIVDFLQIRQLLFLTSDELIMVAVDQAVHASCVVV